MISLDAWIKINWGTQVAMEKDLGLANKTIHRWLACDPRKLYSLLPNLIERTATSAEDIIRMVTQKEQDVLAISSKQSRVKEAS